MAAGTTASAAPKKKGKKAEPSPLAGGLERESIIHMKGSAAYNAFVDAVHKKSHIPKVQQFRLAYAEWCERNGHGSPPEI